MKKLGALGEKLACKFLEKRGFEILKRNVWVKRFGEIDIIAKKNGIYYFIEVKTLKSHKIFKPEFHYTENKKDKIRKTALFLANKLGIEEFKSSLIAIELLNKKAKIRFYENE